MTSREILGCSISIGPVYDTKSEMNGFNQATFFSNVFKETTYMYTPWKMLFKKNFNQIKWFEIKLNQSFARTMTTIANCNATDIL